MPKITSIKKYSDDEVNLRTATMDDMKKVFDLANDKTVRENSFNPEMIKYENHKKWFVEKINCENYLILLAEIEENFAGQVRFEIDKNNEATIGISICPDFRGQGIASVVVKKGLEYLKNEKPKVKKVIAFIKEVNIPSVKLFEKCDFKLKEKTKVKEQPAYKYILNISNGDD